LTTTGATGADENATEPGDFMLEVLDAAADGAFFSAGGLLLAMERGAQRLRFSLARDAIRRRRLGFCCLSFHPRRKQPLHNT
jgi:hypothetical protein